MKVAIAGIDGKMGQEVLAAVRNVGWEVSVGLGRTQRLDGVRRTMDPHVLVGAADVVVDFTAPSAVVEMAAACAASETPWILGVTGLDNDQWDAVIAASAYTPVFYARNFSLGVATLTKWLPQIVQALDGYDIEIVEAHHRYKADAPSGTALILAEAIASAQSKNPQPALQYGRVGHTPRQQGEIGIHSLRAGGNAGEHTVIIASDGEEIRIQHRAYSRRTFADGAVKAAGFVVGRPPRIYSMEQLVGSGMTFAGQKEATT